MGIAIVRGRSFTARDTSESTPVAVVDETLVRAFFPNADPIGKRISFESRGHVPNAPRIWSCPSSITNIASAGAPCCMNVSPALRKMSSHWLMHQSS